MFAFVSFTTKSTKGLQNKTHDAILELCDVEVDQQAAGFEGGTRSHSVSTHAPDIAHMSIPATLDQARGEPRLHSQSPGLKDHRIPFFVFLRALRGSFCPVFLPSE